MAAAIWMLVVCTLLITGCQRRAYTDLYVERMAGEIRELEDRIFEYDAAYRQTEDELDIIRSENEALRSSLAQRSTNAQHRSNNSPLQQRLEELQDSHSRARSGSDNAPNAMPTTPILPQSDSIIDPIPEPASKAAPKSTPESKGPSAPATNKTGPSKPSAAKDSEALDLEPPEIEMGVPGSIETLPFKLPNASPIPNPNPVPNGILPSPLMPPPLPTFPTTQNRGASNDEQSPMIPLPTVSDPDAIALNQIIVPAFVKKESSAVVQAGATGRLTSSNAQDLPTVRTRTEVIGKPDWIAQPTDMRVVEIAFHPSLCRGSNRESDPNEDGLRLVMQPKNQHGDFLPEVAGMTLVVVDSAMPDGESKIGRWTWTAEELQESLEPIGFSQGFHVAVAWQSKRPIAKSVQVHVRYEMADGRRLVNEKTIELYAPSLGSEAWTPRVSK
ncbi:MAG: hypothetical protein NTW52_15365 [Planctomycetota bacterium]|nr:hypothetical protein [Planctomycetota bacterium]